MYIEKYGIKLSRIDENHLEIVRQMRLKKHVEERMFFQDDISREDQLSWFRKIDNIHNYYFLIQVDNLPIGVVFGKQIDYKRGTSSGGLFIGDPAFLNTVIPVYASIIMLDLTFFILNLHTTRAEIRSDNRRQLAYNKLIGFVIAYSDDNKIILELSRDRYLKDNKIRDKIRQIERDQQSVDWQNIQFEPKDIHSRYLYSGLPVYLQEQVDLELSKVK